MLKRQEMYNGRSPAKPAMNPRQILNIILGFAFLAFLYRIFVTCDEITQLSSYESEKTETNPSSPLQEAASHKPTEPTEPTKPISHMALHEASKDVALVVSKARYEDVTWVTSFCQKFKADLATTSKCTPYIYTMDDEPEEGFLIPHTNVGHEAGAYLSYIVDHYYDLHPFTIFLHGREEHWHNDIAGSKTLDGLPNLRFEAVSRKGYANLRCLSIPGCPDGLYPSIIQQSDIDNQNLVDNFPEIWGEIFGPDTPVPLQIGFRCCAQFAVTKERIRERGWTDYNRFLQWLPKGLEYSDTYGVGWLMEKLWHIIFGMPAIDCADPVQCRCDLYGWCGPHPGTDGKILTPIT
ncbi:uncharacterized protein N7500_004733 [Penicillium coprophilum]|uniref:uncharacterized protein n=1 Tax=Penicillium coprophilum TaxID=36646 RepID=UPI002388F173|nr:uncharacterized protein N7500_004733 [Penicillium coprophilum]KAJ5162903.1 hypothetical protein N7500_004733 [Penicillium coprophilum]